VSGVRLSQGQAAAHATPRPHKRKENSDVSESMPRTDKKPRVGAAQQGAASPNGGAGGPEAAPAGGGGVHDLQTVLHLQKMNQVGHAAGDIQQFH
jgi:hypothetical protein